MSKPKKSVKDEPQEVPGWIVSFSDMVTLLLAFFVLLQTFAHEQDPELFNVGRGSFRRAVSGFGLSTMFSGEIETPARDWRKLKYPSRYKTSDPGVRRVISSDEVELRLAYGEMRRAMETQASDVNEERASVYPADIVFKRGAVSLDADAMQYLKDLARDIVQTMDPAKTKLYIVGLAADERDSRSQWILSAHRAEVVHKALERLLRGSKTGPQWAVFSWGAGPGGRWCRSHGIAAHDGKDKDKRGIDGTHIAISVVRVRNQ